MIRCWKCPLRDLCQVLRAKTDTPTKREWLPDKEKRGCPLYNSVKSSGKLDA